MKALDQEGAQLKNDYIPEACVFDRPPSVFQGRKKDILGSHSKPSVNQKQAIEIILIACII